MDAYQAPPGIPPQYLGGPPGPGGQMTTMTVTTTMTFTTLTTGDQPPPPVPPPIILSWLAGNNNPAAAAAAAASGGLPPQLMLPPTGGGFNMPPMADPNQGLYSHSNANGLSTPPGSSRGAPVIPDSTPRKRSRSILLGTASMSRNQGKAIIDENSLINIATSLSSTPPTSSRDSPTTTTTTTNPPSTANSSNQPAQQQEPLPQQEQQPKQQTSKPVSSSVARPATTTATATAKVKAKEEAVNEDEEEYEEVEEEVEYEDYEDVEDVSQKKNRQPAGTEQGSPSMNPRNVKKYRKLVMRNRDSTDQQDPLSATKGEMPSIVSRKYESFLPRVMVLYEWEARSEDELSLQPGNVVIVYEKDPSGWWRGRTAGSEGNVSRNAQGEEEDVVVKIASFPYNYTRPLRPMIKISQKISQKIFETQLRLAEINEGKGQPDDTYAVTGPTREELEAQRPQQQEQQKENGNAAAASMPAPTGDSSRASIMATPLFDDAAALLEVLDEMEQITSMFDMPSETPAIGGLDSFSAKSALSALAALDSDSAPAPSEPNPRDSIIPSSSTTPSSDSSSETPPSTSASTTETTLVDREIEPPSTSQPASTIDPTSSVPTPTSTPTPTPAAPVDPTPGASHEDTNKEAIDLLDACLDLIDSSTSATTTASATTDQASSPRSSDLTSGPSAGSSPISDPRRITGFGLGPLSPRDSSSPTRHKMMIASARSISTGAVLSNLGEQTGTGGTNINATSTPINKLPPNTLLGAKKNKNLDKQGRPKDRRPTWIPDEAYVNCMLCKSTFSLINRRHHCRNCGMLVCAKCCAHKMPLPQLGYQSSQAVCNSCAIDLSASNV